MVSNSTSSAEMKSGKLIGAVVAGQTHQLIRLDLRVVKKSGGEETI